MREQMKLKLSGKKVKGFSKIRGLMFKIKKEALVFEFEKDTFRFRYYDKKF